MRTITLFFLLFLMMSLFSCHKVNLCGLERDVTSGHIEALVELNCFIGSENHRIIRNKDALEALFDELSCTGEQPQIDFSSYTLLGQFGGASGCERYFSRNLRIDGNARKYVFSVRVSECGGCEPWVTQWHWVLVPVLPEEYEVEFVFETN